MHKKYFGTDGIRGKVGSDVINPEFMLRLGWATGKVLAATHSATVLIGKDTRLSGYMIESALQAGLIAGGVNIRLTGPMPTPAIAHLTHSVRADAGIVISASHNPYDDNGIKFFDNKGLKLSHELELAIEKKLEQPMETVNADLLGRALRMDDARGRYIEFCKSTFPADISLKGLKIVVDCANGATYSIAPHIFYELGAEVIVIGDQPDGFNINKNCGATHIAPLQQRVITEKADIGIAFDGDGDRVVMVDHTGIHVNGDEILCILALFHKMSQRGQPIEGVVGTLMSNLGLEQAMREHGIQFERTPVGDRHILHRLLKKGWFLGGEESGHIVDLSKTTTGDGIITALQILGIMQLYSKSIAELKKQMIRFPQTLLNVPIKKRVNIHSNKEIEATISAIEKALNKNGRVLLRPSGTEPVIRIMIESNNLNQSKQLAKELAMVVEKIQML